MTAGAASGNNRERRLAQSKGNPRRPNARIFLRIQSRCDLPQPGFLRAKRIRLRPTGRTYEEPQYQTCYTAVGTIAALQPLARLWLRFVPPWRHKNRQGRKTPGSTGTQHSITFQPQSRSLFRTPVPVSSSAPPAPSGLRPDPSWDPTREPTAAGESRFSPRCSRSGRCCPATRGAAAWHARG